jgi:hypothetical protein
MGRGTIVITGTGWRKIMVEDFEGDFPPPDWAVFDDSTTDGGEYFWGKRECKALSGSHSLWAGGGGLDGGSLACTDNYANNLSTWLGYGPVDLRQVTDAELQFALWADLEAEGLNVRDTVAWMASLDGLRFWGLQTSGLTVGWIPESLNLTSVPTLGNVTGEPAVYLSWLFKSDASNPTAYGGAFVDDAALWVYVPPSPTPPPPTATLPITRHTTLADFAGGRSHDGTIVGRQQGDGALALAAQASALGDWERWPSLPRKLCAFAAVAAQGHIFIIGGNSLDGYQRRVYSAPIGEDGRLGRWREAALVPQALVGHGAAAANGHLFVVGGWNAFDAQDTVFSARVHPDGSLGEWSTLPPLPQPLAFSAVVAAQGYLYVLGGNHTDYSVSDQVYRATINADGTVGDWQPLADPLPSVAAGMSGLAQFVALVFNDDLYILGGTDYAYEWDGVFRAPIRADGSLGSWEETQELFRTLSGHAGVVTRGGILVAGGVNSRFSSQKAVYWAAVRPDGSLGPWMAQPDLLYPMMFPQLVVGNGYVYNLGGCVPNPGGAMMQNHVFGSVLAASLQTTTQVLTGCFNHQFELGQIYPIRHLRWGEEGDRGQVQVRYRVAAASGAYGPWSGFTAAQPIAVNAEGPALEYQILYQRQGSSANDKVVTQVEIELGPTPTVYLPLVLR